LTTCPARRHRRAGGDEDGATRLHIYVPCGRRLRSFLGHFLLLFVYSE
jgi:hypothetical protein